MTQKVGDILGKYRTRRVSLIYIFCKRFLTSEPESHLCACLTSVQVSSLCKSHICASLTSVQVSHRCKSHICASLTSVQVSHRCKSHICASLIFVQVSHLCKSHICASLTSVQVSHLCKSHICASLTSVQVSHLSKNLIFVQVLIHAHACTFLEHSCILGYLGPNRTEHVNQSHIFPILSLVLSDHQENENQFKIIPLVVLRDAVVLSGEP